ncbi:capsid assembly protein [Bartonella sp. DGB2]|uniref:capsid assembly protein n=2 Tax=Bartonella sp. DGB2 TaxID=3388426 RepID=UPI00399009A4
MDTQIEYEEDVQDQPADVEGVSEQSPTEEVSSDQVSEQAEDIAEQAGVDVSAIETQWLEDGTIPQTELKKLEQIGITQDMVQEFVQYRYEKAREGFNGVIEDVGGQETFTKMKDWAAKNWDETQLDAYNKAVNSGDKGQVAFAIKALKADYEKLNKRAPKLLNVANQQTKGGMIFQSTEEIVAAKTDPRYKSDPAYRRKITDAIKRSVEHFG